MRAMMAISLALALAAPVAASAQSSLASAAPPTPERLRLARAVFEAQGGVSNLTAALSRAIDGMTAGMPAGTDAARASQEAARAVMAEKLPQILDAQAVAFAQTFNEQQLSDILAFYKTPTGQFMRDHLPEVTGRVGAEMGRLMPAITVEILERTCAKVSCTDVQKQQLAALKQRIAASPPP